MFWNTSMLIIEDANTQHILYLQIAIWKWKTQNVIMQHIYQIFLEDLKRPFNKGKREEAKSRHGLKLL